MIGVMSPVSTPWSWQEEFLRDFERGARRVVMGVDYGSGSSHTAVVWGRRGGKREMLRRAREAAGIFDLELRDGVWQR